MTFIPMPSRRNTRCERHDNAEVRCYRTPYGVWAKRSSSLCADGPP
ncbi:unannotated protein [freshwater metagenome]|uniref:Unannotated protein n=1 Tax=freshwater metagenome TaxID=449393 RepID=A0A6J7JJ33_9ZZZZ